MATAISITQLAAWADADARPVAIELAAVELLARTPVEAPTIKTVVAARVVSVRTIAILAIAVRAIAVRAALVEAGTRLILPTRIETGLARRPLIGTRIVAIRTALAIRSARQAAVGLRLGLGPRRGLGSLLLWAATVARPGHVAPAGAVAAVERATVLPLESTTALLRGGGAAAIATGAAAPAFPATTFLRERRTAGEQGQDERRRHYAFHVSNTPKDKLSLDGKY